MKCTDFVLGHSTEMAGGHGTFMTNVSPMNGFNGPFGFRRNTPWLRDEPSSFKGNQPLLFLLQIYN